MLHATGVVVLILGFVFACFVYWTLPDHQTVSHHRRDSMEQGRADEPLSFEDSKRDTHQIELYYGRVGVLTMKWLQRWEELKQHPMGLAAGIMSIAGLLAAGCFWLKSRVSDDSPHQGN